MVSLGCVVVDYVQNNLNARLVQFPHHGLELGNLAAQCPGAGVAHIRTKEPDAVVAPVVGEPFLYQVPVCRAIYDRLTEKGNKKMAAYVAVQKERLILIYTLWKNDVAWQEERYG